MKPENAIEVENITKQFKVYMDKGHTLKEKMLFSKRRKYEERKVLNGISFEVKKGEAVGLIGHNGCGKSTTLKLLSKIMYPDSGNIRMKGRVSSLIELGAGFHLDMSGRENIYINASIFGLTRSEIDKRIDDIIAFSELEEFIDNPVRTYSSGMYMRLAFSVAINVDADILLIDEILAVGDANFQSKCFNKLREIKASGTTIVIVSHSLGQIEQICDRSIWIDSGEIREEGSPREIALFYLDYMMQKDEKRAREGDLKENQETTKQEQEGKRQRNEITAQDDKKELGNRRVEITKVEIVNGNIFKIGDEIDILIEYKRNDRTLKETVVGINFIRNDGVYCYGTTTIIDKFGEWQLNDYGKIRAVFKNVMLLQGIYDMDVSLDNGMGTNYHYIKKALQFRMLNQFEELGVGRIEHIWKTEEDS